MQDSEQAVELNIVPEDDIAPGPQLSFFDCEEFSNCEEGSLSDKPVEPKAFAGEA